MTAAETDRDWQFLPKDDIQGNVLAPFRQEYLEFVFLSFRNSQLITEGPAAVGVPETSRVALMEEDPKWLYDAGRRARAWLAAIVDDVASTAQVLGWVGKDGTKPEEATRAEAPRPEGEAEPSAASQSQMVVSFTAAALVTMDPDLSADLVADAALWAGALLDREYAGLRRSSAAIVGDQSKSDPKDWAIGRPDQPPIDVVVTIAADDEGVLEKRSGEIRDQAVQQFGFAVVPVRQKDGTELLGQRCVRGDDKEPFGFRDGISQPGIRGFTKDDCRNGRLESANSSGKPIIAAGEFVFGYERETGSYSGGRRADDPAWMHNGSCQVLLRLEQDVESWKRQMKLLRDSSHADIDVAAKAMGRQEDGSPFAPSRSGESDRAPRNNFNYDDDPDGVVTPRFAHIRKMNPRDEAQFRSRTHRLLRRGRVYREVPPGKTEAVAAGLMFNAFMTSISQQFEHLMYQWAGNPVSRTTVPEIADGPDPLVGASNSPCLFYQQGGQPVEVTFTSCVRTTGALYLFAPSIARLRELGEAGDMVR